MFLQKAIASTGSNKEIIIDRCVFASVDPLVGRIQRRKSHGEKKQSRQPMDMSRTTDEGHNRTGYSLEQIDVKEWLH
jgi:hypothetical protein